MTGPTPTELLLALDSGVRPEGPGRVQDGGGVEPFDRLLDRARAGGLETGLPVTVAPGSGVELSPQSLAALGRLVDRAHAEGATRMAVLAEGRVLDVDVLSRRVLGELDLKDGRVLTGIDGVSRLGAPEDGDRPIVRPPDAKNVSASLLELLGRTGNTAA